MRPRITEWDYAHTFGGLEPAVLVSVFGEPFAQGLFFERLSTGY
jgi:hypothetical protein